MTHALAPARPLFTGFTRFAARVVHIADALAPSVVDTAHTTAALAITRVRESYLRTDPSSPVRLGNARVSVPFSIRHRPELLEGFLVELGNFFLMNYDPTNPDRINFSEHGGVLYVIVVIDDINEPDSHLGGAEFDPDIRSPFYASAAAA